MKVVSDNVGVVKISVLGPTSDTSYTWRLWLKGHAHEIPDRYEEVRIDRDRAHSTTENVAVVVEQSGEPQ